MNLCIKTGADLWVESHQAYFHGDAFLVAETFIFHHTGEPIHLDADQSPNSAKAHCRYILDDSSIFDQQTILYLDSSRIIACDNLLIQEQT